MKKITQEDVDKAWEAWKAGEEAWDKVRETREEAWDKVRDAWVKTREKAWEKALELEGKFKAQEEK